MVVQCPTCQSKFRIADDKVTDRGVRVRCTSCKNVFQVKKPGAANGQAAPGPGNTMDLSSLGAAALARPGARPSSGVAPRSSTPPPRPAAPARSAAAIRSNGAARRLDADDLFGMAELTGDAPLANLAPSPPPPPPPPPAAAKPMPNFDDIDIDVDDGDEPSPPPPPPAKASRPPPPPPAAEAEAPPEEAGAGGADATDDVVALGPSKSTTLDDPFEGMNLGEPGTGALDLSTDKKKDKLAETAVAEAAAKADSVAVPPPPEVPPGRDMVSSALTGLVGAALAVALVVVTALSDDASASWLGIGARNDVVATRVVSGLYDTSSGKPVFYIRGRVENRDKKMHGPIRVTAELFNDGALSAKAESIAGAEPTPEEVWSLRSAADVDKLNRSLELDHVDRRMQPGGSLPFFAVIHDPPADLQHHRLHVKVETVDAWVPPQARKGK